MHESKTTLQSPSNYRWKICALLFSSVVIHYIDRQALSHAVIDPEFLSDTGLQGADGKLNKVYYGYLDASFKAAFMIGFLVMGNILDKVGSKKGFSFAIVTWSLGGIGQAFVSSVWGLGFSRFFLGIGEAGNFPASIKTVAEWFPRKERSLATGIFNTGSNIGIILAPFFMSFFMLNFSWRIAFVVSGLLGIVWVLFWIKMYKAPHLHPKVNEAELAIINSDKEPETEKTPWKDLFLYKQTWAFAVGKFLTDPAWFLYLIWLPTFFKEEHNIDLKSMVIPMIVIYSISAFGSIAGGWLSSNLLKKNWELHKARKTTFFIFALAAIPAYFASTTSNIWIAIPIIGLATAAHAGFSANLFTLVSDTFPKQAIASVVGIGGAIGSIGGIGMSAASGIVYQHWGPKPLFIYGSIAYLLAIGIIHILNPKLKQANIK
ncbi:MAG: MFS transporter [Cytophagales bacterium]|nr:MAG: MFS transporter [Cytophagales bacterium]